jgi:hypothetical protein
MVPFTNIERDGREFSDQIFGLAAWCGNLVTLEIARTSIPTKIAI